MKYAVYCPDSQTFKKVCRIGKRKGESVTFSTLWSNKNNCISIDNQDWGYCSREYYEENNYIIISYTEFLEMELGIYEKEKCKECGREL